MDRIHRIIREATRQTWVCASERHSARAGIATALMSIGLACAAVPAALAAGVSATALPTNGTVTAGTGTVSSNGSTLTVNQQSQNLSLAWQSFNIGRQATVDFLQPNAQSIAVNRIGGSNGSAILGHLNANGQVFLINPNGILFGKNSQVNVGGLVASTLDVSDASLGSGTLTFSGSGTGRVRNYGTLAATPGGYIALLGNRVDNRGVIVAQLGNAVLAGGSAVSLDFQGDGLLSVVVQKSTLDDLASNGGLIEADGGTVLMTAGAKDALLASAVNNTGVVEARTVDDHDGTITLLSGMQAGTTNVGGTLDASAPNGGNGGNIDTSGAQVRIGSGAAITTLAPEGRTGTWLIDPQDYTIAASGGDMTGAQLSSNLASNNITIESSTGATAGSGNINVNDNVTWSGTTLTLTAANNININAQMNAGNNAGLVMNTGTANGADSAVAGGTDNVGLNASGFTGAVNFTGTGNSLTINGTPFTIVTDFSQLVGLSATGDYALGADLDASAYSGMPQLTSLFSGVLDGLGHTISNISAAPSSGAGGALFDTLDTGSVITNLGLSGTVTGSDGTAGIVTTNNGTISNVLVSMTAPNAEIAATNNGTVTNAFTSGTVNGAGTYEGGLVGLNNGTISNSSSSADVSNGYYNGGLVGQNSTSGTIGNSSASGTVTGGTETGGLAGWNDGAITGSSASGQVVAAPPYTVWPQTNDIGGLVGMNTGSIATSSASGAVSGDASNSGGLVGTNSGAISNSSASGSVSNFGYGPEGGLVGTNNGTISDSTASSDVSSDRAALPSSASSAAASVVGGLVGENNGSVDSSSASGDVSADNFQYGVEVGGLVGDNSNSTGTITNAYATGSVSAAGSNNAEAGGLVGGNEGSVTQAYATGAVSGETYSRFGGLVGLNNGSISETYATGAVPNDATSQVGGLVGQNTSSGTISSSYYDSGTTGALAGVGLDNNASDSAPIALTGTQWLTNGPLANGWDTTSTWVMGYPYPILQALPYLLLTPGAGTQIYGSSAITATLSSSQLVTPSGWLLPVSAPVTAGVAPTPNWIGTATSSSAATSNGGQTYVFAGTESPVPGLQVASSLGTLTVTPATLTITGTTVASKTYDGTTTATLSGGTLQGVIGSDNVTLNQLGYFFTANAGTDIGVTATDTLGGSAAGNYVLIQPTGLFASIFPVSPPTAPPPPTSAPANAATAAQLYTAGVSINDTGVVPPAAAAETTIAPQPIPAGSTDATIAAALGIDPGVQVNMTQSIASNGSLVVIDDGVNLSNVTLSSATPASWSDSQACPAN